VSISSKNGTRRVSEGLTPAGCLLKTRPPATAIQPASGARRHDASLVALYLGWRFQTSREARAAAAIQAAGGKVYFNYQEPSLSFTHTSVAMLPEFTYFGQIEVPVNGAIFPPPPTLLEHLTGWDDDTTVHTVEIPLAALTPEVAEAKQLETLQSEFNDKIFPACNQPF
jgi:hypothetical protein